MSVDRGTDEPPGKVALVRRLDCHEAGVRPAVAQRHAKTLRGTDHDVGTELARWRQNAEC